MDINAIDQKKEIRQGLRGLASWAVAQWVRVIQGDDMLDRVTVDFGLSGQSVAKSRDRDSNRASEVVRGVVDRIASPPALQSDISSVAKRPITEPRRLQAGATGSPGQQTGIRPSTRTIDPKVIQ